MLEAERMRLFWFALAELLLALCEALASLSFRPERDCRREGRGV